jgi:rod shape determining protein RodA
MGRIGAREASLVQKARDLHWPLVALVLAVGLVGYGALFSAAGGAHEPWAWRHGLRLAVGLLIMLAIALVDIRLIYRLAWPAYAATVGMLLAVDIMGEISKGAQRWIDLGVIQLQPSELMKVTLILALARWFHGLRPEDARRPLLLTVPALIVSVPVALVLVQPDLGTAIMLAAVGALVLFVAGVPIWPFALGAVATAAAAPFLWTRLHGYQQERVLTFLDPERDPLGAGYHIIQSKIALGSGGFWGKGYLAGSQAQLDFLPEKHTDFAFTLLAEEAGLVGGALVLGLFGMMLALILLVALRCQSQFGRLVAMGAGANVTLYVGINIGMVTGLLPVVGIPLPLVSYGGTAMLALLLMLGLVLSADAHSHTPIPRHASDL